MHPQDAELVRDVFWDLFRQGAITLGLNDSNPNWPFFRLSYAGERILNSSRPWRFHDTTSYLRIIRQEIPDVSEIAVEYLEEASAAFYAGCLLAACVMVGVASEAEFLRLLQIACASPTHGEQFKAAAAEKTILQKISKFRNLLSPLLRSLPQSAREGLEPNFDAVQSLLRIARNDARHPTASAVPDREQVYVYLHLFIPFARQVMRLRDALTGRLKRVGGLS